MNNQGLLLLGTFVGVFAIVTGAYWLLVLLPETRGQAALRRRLKSEDPKNERLRLLKKEEALSNIAALNTALRRLTRIHRPLTLLLDQADVSMNVGTFLMLTTSSFLAAYLVANWYFNIWWIALPIGVIAASIPLFTVRSLRIRRIRAFEEQFPEAIDLIARAMRAGHAFPTGMKMVADEMPPPVGSEFRLLYDKQNYGAPLPDALKSFGERIPSLDARFFVTAVLTQREAGGNLSEVLDRLAAVMRERFRIRREVRVRSAHGRITAFVLAGLPPTLAVLMLSSSPEQMKLLTTDPIGIRMIIVAVILQLVGMAVVRKLVDIEY